MKYRFKLEVVEAIQWCKNGDHPQDGDKEGKIVKYLRHPDSVICLMCDYEMKDHGLIDASRSGTKNGLIVCPGDMIISKDDGTFIPCKPNIFMMLCEGK